ncbi:hypothetical protein BDQ17DRAFT_117477 [Cyathus striatus]|nr:hypothetical protein BDQ17DRAFT_117477 [Cyathus striatus]
MHLWVYQNDGYPKHKCSYLKSTGKQILSYAGNNCPDQAIAYEDNKPRLFSSTDEDKHERPPWVVDGTYHLMMRIGLA